jgi:hypothetical protein
MRLKQTILFVLRPKLCHGSLGRGENFVTNIFQAYFEKLQQGVKLNSNRI